MDSRGLGFVECYNDPANGFPFRLTAVDGVECIASVPSQLFKGKSHAIIAKFEMQDSGVVLLRPMHDPNPKNEPYPDSLMDVATWVTFVVPRVQNLLPANMPSTGVEVID